MDKVSAIYISATIVVFECSKSFINRKGKKEIVYGTPSTILEKAAPHNYDDQVRVIMEGGNTQSGIYEVIKKFLINYEGYRIEDSETQNGCHEITFKK